MVGINTNFSGNGSALEQLSKYDLENIAKYAVGTTIVEHSEGPFDGMGIMMGIEGITGALKIKNWLAINKQNNIDIKKAWANDMAKIKQNSEFTKANFSREGYKNILEYSKKLNEVTEAEKSLMKLKKAQAGEGLFNKIKQSLFKAKVPGADKIEAAEKAIVNAKTAAEAVRTGQAVAGTASETLSLGAKALKVAKGSWLFSAITGLTELVTQVIPAFSQLGAEKGIKQLGKSTIKTAAIVGGWEAGAAAGAAIGSFIPVAGTLVGGIVGSVVGVIGGCLGSWLFSKIASPLTKSELDIAKEEKAEQVAREASQNPESAQKLILAAEQKLQQEGDSSEDAKIAFGSLQKIAKSIQEKGAQQTAGQQALATNSPFSNQKGLQQNSIFQMDWKDKDLGAMSLGYA